MSGRSSARRWLGRAALLLGSAALSLGAAELALRALDVAPSRYAHPWHLETEDKRLGLDVYPDDPRGYFPIDLRDDATRARWAARGLAEVDERYEGTPFAVDFRYSAGLCRGGDVVAAESARVVVIGDSFTEGQGVREEDTFAARLDRALDAQVLNCGRRGYDFPRIHEWFDLKVAELDPDVVVYAMILNDPEQSEAFHARQRFVDDWILDRRRMYMAGDGAPPPGQLRLAALVEDRVEGWRVGRETEAWYREMVGPPNRAGWEATIAHVVAMDAAMRERGGAFVVALWPLMIRLEDYPFRDVHRIIREALESRGVRVIDTLDAFEGQVTEELWVHATDRHPNERAHARFAERLRPDLASALASTPASTPAGPPRAPTKAR